MIDPDPEPPPELDPEPPQPPVDRFAEAVARYNGFDYDGDGVKEIEALSSLPFSSSNPPPAYAPKGMVVVLVDPRILAGSSGYSPIYVQVMLDLWGSDLRNEGYDPRFVRAQVSRRPNHPDGVTVLAMRRFLRDVRSYHNLSGAILVGDFPEPTILRSTLFRSEVRDPTTLGSQTVDDVDTLSVGSELIALRSDLVLADLDGGWESVYRKTMTHRDATMVPLNVVTSDPTWPLPTKAYLGNVFSSTLRSYSDVFYVRDETATVTDLPAGIMISVNAGNEPGPELAPSDRTLVNPIARPEIHVTRINARHIAKQPFNWDLESALDANGVPRTLPARYHDLIWREDVNTELRVLMDYFQRNRSFRNGNDNGLPFRTAVVRSTDNRLANPLVYNDMLKLAHPSLASTPSVIVDGAKLDDYLWWLEQPGALRGIISHADATVSVFGDVPEADILAHTGTPWFWKRDAATDTLIPTFAPIGNGQIEIYRALWENRKLAGKGQRLYIHNGCEVNSPHNGSTMSYSSTSYAINQNGESQLFYTNGLALLARAKVFFDSPRNVGASIAQKGNFGASLHGYVAADAADPTLAPAPPGSTGIDRRNRTLNRKKTYFWSILGDYTLRVKY